MTSGLDVPTGARRARLTFRPPVPVDLPHVPTLLAGASEVDITPPPGLPRAGYSRNAHTGTGFRTRLRARVVHLRSGTTSLALITTDLLGGSAVVQQLVASAVASSTDVPLAGVFLGATHTHGAPGQFHGTDFYNRYSSNEPGLDPRWTAFVASRIASAVVFAVASRKPAALAWGRVEVPGVARNRSLPAHLLNPSASEASSVNPWLELLRVDAVSGAPVAALAVYSIHGTCVPMSSSTYNADLFSYVSSSFATAVSGSGTVAGSVSGPVSGTVFGVLQGTHGDQTPALAGPAGHPEAARIGGTIGTAAAALYSTLESSLSTSVSLAAGFREVPLGVPPLPARPAVGAALVAGAKENETPVVTLIPPFRAGYGKGLGVPFGGRGPQGAKWVLGSRWLQPLLLPLEGFPRVLPLHVVRIGPVVLAGVPFEVTLESGRRFAVAVEAGFSVPVRAVISSVADEYAGYCTTGEEYRAQYYEGGHTLYGPRTQAFTAGVLTDLAAAVDRAGGSPTGSSSGPAPGVRSGMVHGGLPERRFSLRVRSYLPDDWSAGGSGHLEVAGAPTAGRESRTGESFVEWPLSGPAPHQLTWHEPMVRLETPAGPVLDNGDGSLEIVHLGGPGPPRRTRLRNHLFGVAARASGGRPTADPEPSAPVHRYVVRWYPGSSLPELPALRLTALPVSEEPGSVP